MQIRRVRFYAAALVFLLSGCADGPEPVADKWATWQSYAGSADTSQYSSLTGINVENVTGLEVAWTFPSGEAAHRSTPIVIDDVMFVVANGGVAALNAATGEQKWFSADCVSPNARGLVYWQSDDGSQQRLLVIRDPELLALDARTGKRLAFGERESIDLRLNLGRDPETIGRIASMSPGRVHENLIILGSAMGDDAYDAAPGDIRAYDVLTGEMVWTFHTIPHPGEAGYETWPPDAYKTIGAANAWTAMSLDEERGIIYANTGAPSYHFHGGNRLGDNLFSNSLLALNASTGERLWHFQAVHHDVWDYDIAMAPKLLTVERGGQRIDAVTLAGKHGFLFVFDRVTGEPVFPIEERAVPQTDVPGEQTSPTQPYPLVLPPFANQTLSEDNLSPYADPEEVASLASRIRQARNEGLFTPPSFRGSVNAPGSRGGAQHGNGAVIPDAGLLFMAVIESPTIPKLELRNDLTAEQFLAAGVAATYTATCAPCHGARGKGQPPLIPGLAGLSDRMSGTEFASIVKQGRGRMPAVQNLPETQLSALMDHIGQLDRLAVAEPSDEVPELETPAMDVSDAQRYRSGYHHFFSDNGLVGPPPWSKLIAYDLNEGVIVWQKPYGDVPALVKRGITGTGSLFPTNSLMATASGLLFSATNDRKIRAWDQASGAVLWSADLPADPGGIPATYTVDGRQYLVATATRGEITSSGDQHAYVVYAVGGAAH
ncbi:MAG: PQQ-binding-like beta-propeller repeat protein [Proteobacteria bacterium]|nr:PQQ-binding-like beta-propeller repeat protein [Pseudomonadota bacterium]